MLYGIKISIQKIDSNPVVYLGLTKGEELPKGLGTGDGDFKPGGAGSTLEIF